MKRILIPLLVVLGWGGAGAPALAGLDASGPVAYEGVVTCLDTNRREITVHGADTISRQKVKLPGKVVFKLRVIPDIKHANNRRAKLEDIQWGTRVNVSYARSFSGTFSAKTIRILGLDTGRAGQVSSPTNFYPVAASPPWTK